MKIKQLASILFLTLLCSVLAVAQGNPLTNITGGGTKGTIPVFTAAHKIGNSSAVQGPSGGVTATNKQADSLGNGAGAMGVLSNSGSLSGTGSGWGNGGAGAWGDGGPNDSSSGLANYAVVATTDNKSGLIANTNGASYYTIYGYNYNTGAYPFASFNGDGYGCSIDTIGDLSCTGSKNAVIPVGKKNLALAAIESPKNWFEDFGSEQLRGGVATVRLDPTFVQTVNARLEYHVFLTPNGDCKGLYVSQKTPTSFEVRELGNGNSSVKFDYRITALRKNFEKVRFADHTREFSHITNDGRIPSAQ